MMAIRSNPFQDAYEARNAPFEPSDEQISYLLTQQQRRRDGYLVQGPIRLLWDRYRLNRNQAVDVIRAAQSRAAEMGDVYDDAL